MAKSGRKEMIENRQPCKYCGIELLGYEKNQETNKWVNYKLNKDVHKYEECKAIQAKKKQQSQMKFPDPPKQVQSGDAPSGITTNSVYIVASDTRKEVRELKKEIQTLNEVVDSKAQEITLLVKQTHTLMEVVDSMAQQVTLIVKQTGYPKPEPVIQNLCKECGKDYTYGNASTCHECLHKGEEPKDDIKANPGFAEFLDNQKAIEEANGNIADSEIINPMRLPKMEDEVEQKAADGWEIISEKFICHGCESPKFNGFEKYGTKVCPDCKEGIDAQNP